MSFTSIGRTLVRRWYVTLLGVAITAGLVVAVLIEVPPTYQARASVLLIPPKTGQEVNPYLGLGGLQEVSDVLSRAVSDTQTADQIIAAGGSGKYTVGRDTSTSGPIILITTDASKAAAALNTKQQLIDKMGPTLKTLQLNQNVPQASLITTVLLTDDKAVSAQRKSQLRALIGAAALGILLTIMLVALVESRLTRRRRQAESVDPEPAEIEPAPAPEARAPATELDQDEVRHHLPADNDRQPAEDSTPFPFGKDPADDFGPATLTALSNSTPAAQHDEASAPSGTDEAVQQDTAPLDRRSDKAGGRRRNETGNRRTRAGTHG